MINFSKAINLSSGTVIIPIFGSIVQNGKFADCAFAFDKQLNNVDLPTFGNPTIPHFNDILLLFKLILAKIKFYNEPIFLICFFTFILAFLL